MIAVKMRPDEAATVARIATRGSAPLGPTNVAKSAMVYTSPRENGGTLKVARLPIGQETTLTLEENIQQLRDSLTVTSAQVLRHETRIKEHQKWLEDNELAYQRHRIMMAEHDARMVELDDKIDKIAAAQLLNEELSKSNAKLLEAFLLRGGNGKH